jgi:hypothetical protein
MDTHKVILEVRWNAVRRRFDVVRGGSIVQCHTRRGGALAAARALAHELIVAGQNVEIMVVEPDGSHIKDRL